MQQATIYEGRFVDQDQPRGWFNNPIEGFGPYIFNNIVARDYVVCGYTNNRYDRTTDTLLLESKTGMSNDVIYINCMVDVEWYKQMVHGNTVTFKGCLKYDHSVNQWYIHWIINTIKSTKKGW